MSDRELLGKYKVQMKMKTVDDDGVETMSDIGVPFLPIEKNGFITLHNLPGAIITCEDAGEDMHFAETSDCSLRTLIDQGHGVGRIFAFPCDLVTC